MKKQFFALVIGTSALLTASCQSRQSTSESTKPTEATSTQCYGFTSAQDTIRLAMTRTGDAVKGKLTYQLSGKDRNVGTLSGQMHGDTLRADYTFQSEGVESVREVAFLKKEGGFVEGFGPVEERDNKMVFAKTGKLTFSSSFMLALTNCTD